MSSGTRYDCLRCYYPCTADYVCEDKDDMSTTQIQHKDGDTVTEERWEVQQAWDKQGNFLSPRHHAR